MRLIAIVLVLVLSACTRSASVESRGSPVLARDDAMRARLDVRIVSDEADAVVAILDRRAAGIPPGEAYWQRLFAAEGYRRLTDRERAFRRELSDSAFRAFVMSDTLIVRWVDLQRTLREWNRIDPLSAAIRAFDYLPDDARIRARIYPVIKPRTNSFVWETATNPAIFLYVDPRVSAVKFENTLAHELHHIGVADACRGRGADTSLAPGLRAALEWMSGFAEGRAVLAAAGSADVHPHAMSDEAERAVWERDVVRVPTDLQRLEAFFLDLLDEKLSPEERTRRGFAFISTDTVPQAAFYTVGWTMATVVERELGRAALNASTCDPAAFLMDYNHAVARARSSGRAASLPTWSDRLIARIGAATRATSRSAPAWR